MQDIDFDELDRAVNSLINPADSPAAQSVPVPQERPVMPEPVAASAPAQSEPRVVAEDRNIQPVVTMPSQRPSTGRFMDVVHPSSDMRTASQGRSMTPRPAQPIQQPVSPAQPTETPVAPSSFDVIETPAAYSAPEVSDELTFEEIAPQEQEPDTKPDAAPAPLETPFLSDPQVEKRPLGAFSSAANPQPPVLDLSAELAAAIKEEEPVALIEAEATPDEELVVIAPQPEPKPVMTIDSVESLEVSEEALIGSSETSDTSPATARAFPESTPEEELAPEPPVIRTVAATPTPVGPISIAQQYREHPSSNDQASGAIYDTESYHQPLAHPAKKQSSILVIVWILGLIVVGAGVGAAIFFLVLPNLN